ncbi:MAG: VWA domain-containing protein [Deltaproteobacteria bacterium]|nr:VWA domain-containing protein [Deltaproteobacteria bacterium]
MPTLGSQCGLLNALACTCCACFVLLQGASADARKPRLRIEHLDARACARGVIDVHAVEVELEGVIRPRRLSEYRLVLDAKHEGRAENATSFGKSGKPLYVVILVQASESYGATLDMIKRGLERLFEALPPKTHYALLAYHAEVEQLTARAPLARARAALDRLEAHEGTTDLALLAGLRRGLKAAQVPSGDTRRLLIVISDGMDRMPDWEAFRRLGKRALKGGVAIFPIAFSPIDERGPLLNLGEIAKRSRGMLRWARKATDINAQLRQLGRAISGQLVLTFKLPDRCRVGHDVQLAGGALLSNVVRLEGRQGKVVKGSEASQGKGAEDNPWRWVGFAGLLLLAVTALTGMTFWLLRAMRGSRRG